MAPNTINNVVCSNERIDGAAIDGKITFILESIELVKSTIIGNESMLNSCHTLDTMTGNNDSFLFIIFSSYNVIAIETGFYFDISMSCDLNMILLGILRHLTIKYKTDANSLLILVVDRSNMCDSRIQCEWNIDGDLYHRITVEIMTGDNDTALFKWCNFVTQRLYYICSFCLLLVVVMLIYGTYVDCCASLIILK